MPTASCPPWTRADTPFRTSLDGKRLPRRFEIQINGNAFGDSEDLGAITFLFGPRARATVTPCTMGAMSVRKINAAEGKGEWDEDKGDEAGRYQVLGTELCVKFM